MFSDLPKEIREVIWEYTLEDTPEVWILPPKDSGHITWPAKPYVLTGLPTIMHVCYESRAVTLKYTTFARQELGDGSFVLVPCRPFRPDLDCVYSPVARTGMVERHPIFSHIRHIAFPADSILYSWKTVHRMVRVFHELEDLSMVFGAHYGVHNISGCLDVSIGFQESAGRYQFVDCPEEGLMLQIDDDTHEPAGEEITAIRKDLDVLCRLVYDEQRPVDAAPKKPIVVKTVNMFHLGKNVILSNVFDHIQHPTPLDRPYASTT